MTNTYCILELRPGLWLKADSLSRATTTDIRQARMFQTPEGAMRALQAIRETPPSRRWAEARILPVGTEEV